MSSLKYLLIFIFTFAIVSERMFGCDDGWDDAIQSRKTVSDVNRILLPRLRPTPLADGKSAYQEFVYPGGTVYVSSIDCQYCPVCSFFEDNGKSSAAKFTVRRCTQFGIDKFRKQCEKQIIFLGLRHHKTVYVASVEDKDKESIGVRFAVWGLQDGIKEFLEQYEKQTEILVLRHLLDCHLVDGWCDPRFVFIFTGKRDTFGFRDRCIRLSDVKGVIADEIWREDTFLEELYIALKDRQDKETWTDAQERLVCFLPWFQQVKFGRRRARSD